MKRLHFVQAKVKGTMTSKIFFARYILNILNSMTPCTYNFSTITSYIYPVACSPSLSTYAAYLKEQKPKANKTGRKKNEFSYFPSIHNLLVIASYSSSSLALSLVLMQTFVIPDVRFISPHSAMHSTFHISHSFYSNDERVLDF